MSEYNGWTNYETWNIELWLRNDWEYCSTLRKWMSEDVTAEELQKYVMDTFGETNDDGIRYDDPVIDWEEVLESLREDFGLEEV